MREMHRDVLSSFLTPNLLGTVASLTLWNAFVNHSFVFSSMTSLEVRVCLYLAVIYKTAIECGRGDVYAVWFVWKIWDLSQTSRFVYLWMLIKKSWSNARNSIDKEIIVRRATLWRFERVNFWWWKHIYSPFFPAIDKNLRSRKFFLVLFWIIEDLQFILKWMW